MGSGSRWMHDELMRKEENRRRRAYEESGSMMFSEVSDFKDTVASLLHDNTEFNYSIELCKYHSSNRSSISNYHPTKMPKTPKIIDGYWRDYHVRVVVRGRLFETNTWCQDEAEELRGWLSKLGGKPLRGNISF